MMDKEDIFLENLAKQVGQEDYSRESIKKRYPVFKEYMRKRFKLSCPIVIVGGTNGKGGVCQGITHLANLKNKKVALWTSPHIMSLKERYYYNGEYILWEELVSLIKKELIPTPNKPKLSMFEILFVVFMEWVKNKNLDLLVLEVGLGGRLDAVNVFDGAVSIITSISRDHTAYLGHRYEGILEEKIQIARKGGFFIGQSPLGYVRQMMEQKIKKIGCPFVILSQTQEESYQEVNQKIVKEALAYLYPHESFSSKLPERVSNWKELIYFNGAHNIDGMRQFLMEGEKFKNYKALLAFSKRPIDEIYVLLKMFKKCQGHFKESSMSYFDHPRSLSEDESRQVALDSGILFEENWKNYINETIKKKEKLFIMGSYYFVGEVKRFLFSRERGQSAITGE